MGKSVMRIDTDAMTSAIEGTSLLEARQLAYKNSSGRDGIRFTIAVTAYNRLSKTRRCVESILKYTQDFDYELLLIDNGSTDETLDFFQNVKHENTTIWTISKNIGFNYPFSLALRYFKTEYFIHITNDVYVTKNWLSNLVKCYESDPKIGMVCPVSSSISNLQEVDLKFHGFDDMQRKAALFNRSDPCKWQERMRIIDIVLMVTRDVCDSSGILDLGFYHDFGDDDTSARIRHAGYKLMLCGDTYVCHDHDFRNMEDKDPREFQKSIEAGRANYREKYHGIDAWDDINNFELPMMELLRQQKHFPSVPSILGVDVRCGTPILQVRNTLRSKGVMESTSAAFTTQAKYFYDLQFVTDAHTECDRIDFISGHYRENSFDIVVLGEPVNTYAEPIRVTDNLFRLVRRGGKLLLKLRNVASIGALFNLLGIQESQDGDMPVQLSAADFISCLKAIGAGNIQKIGSALDVPQDTVKTLVKALRDSNICRNPEQAVRTMNIQDYVFMIEK